jgi:hypothetical protein
LNANSRRRRRKRRGGGGVLLLVLLLSLLLLVPRAGGLQLVCVYYCSTYFKGVRVGGGRAMEDMCYERLRAEACVN